jgi:BirA family transcriptional regulator, biotin operon repressor / biotin---[acetyl-CoA-carboxylase] ligase
VYLETTGSTNDRARQLAQAGAPHGTVVIAERQTAGRGRQGRTWSAPPGRALTLSVLARVEAAGLGLLPLGVALAVSEACEQVAPVRCQIKWPNDVWIDGRKVAGILVETRPQEGWAVLGIGLNVDTAADELEDELRETATSLRIAVGGPASRETALDALSERLQAWLDRLVEPGLVVSAYRERDALAGQRVTWLQDGRAMTGEARGIDDDGALVVFTDENSSVRLDAGEVHLERPGNR